MVTLEQMKGIFVRAESPLRQTSGCFFSSQCSIQFFGLCNGLSTQHTQQSSPTHLFGLSFWDPCRLDLLQTDCENTLQKCAYINGEREILPKWTHDQFSPLMPDLCTQDFNSGSEYLDTAWREYLPDRSLSRNEHQARTSIFDWQLFRSSKKSAPTLTSFKLLV